MAVADGSGLLSRDVDCRKQAPVHHIGGGGRSSELLSTETRPQARAALAVLVLVSSRSNKAEPRVLTMFVVAVGAVGAHAET